MKNLTVEGSIDVTDNTNNNIYAGGIVGLNNGTVTNCTAAVTITISNQKESIYAGGIAGTNSKTITACHSDDASINATSNSYVYAGGIAGTNSGTIKACYSDNASISAESISNDACAGGIAGSNESRGTITAGYSIINEIYIKGGGTNSYKGAIAGSNSGVTIRACYWSGNAYFGIGNLVNDNTSRVYGTTTWQNAVVGMNNNLDENFGWQWQTTDKDTPPTLVEKTN